MGCAGAGFNFKHLDRNAELIGRKVVISGTRVGCVRACGRSKITPLLGGIGVGLDVDGEYIHVEGAYFTDADGLLGTEGGTAHYDEAEDRLDKDNPKATAVFGSQLEIIGEYLSLKAEDEYL